jgi:AraC-like DNA-binding protein
MNIGIKNFRNKAGAGTLPATEDWPELAWRAKYKVIPLARAAGMGERRLRRWFHKTFGCAPRLWLKRVRLEEAQRLLDEGRTVKWAAYSLFFPDLAAFNHQFSAAFDMTPRDYVRLIAAAQESLRNGMAAASGNGDSLLPQVSPSQMGGSAPNRRRPGAPQPQMVVIP